MTRIRGYIEETPPRKIVKRRMIRTDGYVPTEEFIIVKGKQYFENGKMDESFDVTDAICQSIGKQILSKDPWYQDLKAWLNGRRRMIREVKDEKEKD